jgi:hypothetical protein
MSQCATVVVWGWRHRCFRPRGRANTQRTFEPRGAVRDLLAWYGLSYGAHGWHAGDRRGSGELDDGDVVLSQLLL